MDNFIVDLDKVLDDFEEDEEKASSLSPGQEIGPGGYSQFLQRSEENPWLVQSKVKPSFPIQALDETPTYDKHRQIAYDIPYEPPEKFDLSEAEFAPSPPKPNNNMLLSKEHLLNGTGSLSNSLEKNNDFSSPNKNIKSVTIINNLESCKKETNVIGHNFAILNNIETLKSPDIKYPTQESHESPNDVMKAGHYNYNFNDNVDNSESDMTYVKSLNQAASQQGNSDLQVNHAESDDHRTTEEPSSVVTEKHDAIETDHSSHESISPDANKVPPLECQTSTNLFSRLSNFSTLSCDANVGPAVANNRIPRDDASSVLAPEHCHSNVITHNDTSVATTSVAPHVTNEQREGQTQVVSNLSACPNDTEDNDLLPSYADFIDQCKGVAVNVIQNERVGEMRPSVNDSILTPAIRDSENLMTSPYSTNDSGAVVNLEGFSPVDIEGAGIERDNDAVSPIAFLEDKSIEGSGVGAPKPVGFGNFDEIDEGVDDLDEYLKDDEPLASADNTHRHVISPENTEQHQIDYFDNCEDYGKSGLMNGLDRPRSLSPLESKGYTNTSIPIVPLASENDDTAIDTPHEQALQNMQSLTWGQGIGDNAEQPISTVPGSPIRIENNEQNVTFSEASAASTLLVNMDSVDSGARPKEPAVQGKKSRPNSLLGLSKVILEYPTSGNSGQVDIADNGLIDAYSNEDDFADDPSIKFNPQRLSPQEKKKINMGIKLQLEKDQTTIDSTGIDESLLIAIEPETPPSLEDFMESSSPVMRRPSDPSPTHSATGHAQSAVRPQSWSPGGSNSLLGSKFKRPTSLNLPPRQSFSPEEGEEENTLQPAEAESTSLASQGSDGSTDVPDDSLPLAAAESIMGLTPDQSPERAEPVPPPPPVVQSTLGRVAPVWAPDSSAPVCMICSVKFTFTKRRHHCRACGKVLCSSCCNMKSRLIYMDNKEARVCMKCHEALFLAETSGGVVRNPNPNVPSEYCSTIPPPQQANAHAQLPTVMVPTGVLKHEGTHRRSEPKQVMFSDGIRPGGDLTELDAPAVARLPARRTGRQQRKITDRATLGEGASVLRPRLKSPDADRNQCLIPEDGLPPLAIPEDKGEFILEHNPDSEQVMPQIRGDTTEPVIFAINANLFVKVKIINLDCCVNRICWCFTTRGMCNVGQDEIVVVLECLPEENVIPRDIFCHLNTIYEDAGKGNTVSDMGHTIFNQSFLGSKDHGGFLYIRPTFQCLQKIMIPSPPYVFAVLLQKWETPWAKVFPIRLLLRLGAEYRYYPCPLVSIRNSKPVFFEIGHTIMNLLADFRNYQYMLPLIRGIVIHMEDKRTVINCPRNRYDELMKVVTNSNEHVMALGANFSPEADSHLVCIQNDEGNYQTQAINIQNKTRKVTGASFVVFNGALKTSSGLTAKSSIVEDGLMVQIFPDSMLALKQAIKDMQNYTINCGTAGDSKPEEVVHIQWVDDDKSINIGVKSPIDLMSMDGIRSIHLPNSTDYVGERKVIRWTEVFFILNNDSPTSKWEPVDLSRLAETLAQACCIALTPHLETLFEATLAKIGLRVTVESEKVGYDIGGNGEKLPNLYMNDLDSELIPVIHSAASQNQEGPIVLELIFHILN